MHGEEAAQVAAPEGGDLLQGPPWKVLVVDDDEFVHRLTELVLGDYRFQGRGLQLLHAHSAAAARGVLAQHPDVAVILLDVVMESEQAGLDLVRFVREEAGNALVRIILRTGQPGRAPERDVILDHDINDYRHKAELSELKLMTSLTAALRSYEQMQTLAVTRDGMAALSLGASRMLAVRGEAQLAAVALDTLQTLAEAAAMRVAAVVGRVAAGGIEPVAASQGVTGPWLEQAARHLAACSGPWGLRGPWFVARCAGAELVVVAEFAAPPSPLVAQMLDTVALQLALALDNVALQREIAETQGEIVATLGEVVETRSKETAAHVRLVAESAALLAAKAGLPREEVELLRRAAPLHDVGKIGIPDAILLKPGRLTPQEFAVVQTHTTIGHAIFGKSSRRLLQAAATIALEHHERWDGTGYPRGLRGEAIHVFGRVTALADVVDALLSPRVYKPAWPLDATLDYVASQRGRQFDPRLVDLFLADVPAFLALRAQVTDRTIP